MTNVKRKYVITQANPTQDFEMKRYLLGFPQTTSL